MPVHLSGQLICTNAEEAALVRAYLPNHIALSRAEPGCLSFDVVAKSALIWSVEESFATRAAFDAHQLRTKASVWGTATAGITRTYAITETGNDG